MTSEERAVLQDQFDEECRIVDMAIEYGKDYVGEEKYIIVTELSREDLYAKYAVTPDLCSSQETTRFFLHTESTGHWTGLQRRATRRRKRQQKRKVVYRSFFRISVHITSDTPSAPGSAKTRRT